MLLGVPIPDGSQFFLDLPSDDPPVVAEVLETAIKVPQLGVDIAEEDRRVLRQGIPHHGLQPQLAPDQAVHGRQSFVQLGGVLTAAHGAVRLAAA
jgi:hypothetical protein